ncbi:hypothetical protein V5O48_003491 [Marasmius crinis-equi]|uniref:DNA replication regulator SLD2 n=1 Tax=Marasmius crinis-equi TaxID=585013 RepID=A0ABR3FSR1_9AGAR
MGDVASVRAEIKAWERSFKEENNRHPEVDDIKKNPAIADKYKLYKKLSKASQQTALPKSRPTQQTAPLSSFNPFSPQKNKGKQAESPSRPRISRPNNPFATPSKSIPIPRIREPSPSPTPSTRPASSTSTSTSTSNPPIAPLNLVPDPPSAVVRARKRLRGEPVSPSPNKDKRRRIHSFRQSTLPFARRRGSGSSDSDEDEDMDDDKAGSPSIDDSPMKVRTGAKSFQALFEDGNAVKNTSNNFQAALERAQSNKPSAGLFGRPTKDASSISFDDEMDWEMEDGTSRNKKPAAASDKSKARLKKWAPTKDNLYAVDPPASHPEPQKSENAGKKPSKRAAMSGGSDEDRPENTARSRSASVKPTTLPLLPPSPPAAGSSSSSHNPKNSTLVNGKAKISRKKTKLSAKDREDEDEDSSASENADIKVRVRSFTRGVTPAVHVDADGVAGDNEATEDVDVDADPILRYFRPAQRTSGGGFTSWISSEGEEDFTDNDGDFDHFSEPGLDATRVRPAQHKKRDDTRGEGSVEIDLPDKMKHILALSASESRARGDRLKEEMVAESLLYGRRAGRYDASRGGEIWDIGDVSGPDDGDDGDLAGSARHKRAELEGDEDDWEGEPVPWEIGEL